MNSRPWTALATVIILALIAPPSFGQEPPVPPAPAPMGPEKKEESKELKFMGAPYLYDGPDTGAGFGFSLIYRDMLGRTGRDTTLDMSYTEKGYQFYSLDWQEPEFLSPNGRLHLYGGYEAIPARHFYGIGNDSRENDDCNWSSIKWEFKTGYYYRWPKTKIGTVGLRAEYQFYNLTPGNGKLDDKDAGNYGRPIRGVFPGFYRSPVFDPANLSGIALTLYHDSRVDRFPLGGGREEVVYPMRGGYEEFSVTHYDSALGSDYTFNRYSIDLRRFIPVISQDTIIAMRLKIQITEGNAPFYEMPSLSGDNLRGFFEFRFLDMNAAQFNLELRQGFFPNKELPLFKGAIVLKYPSLFVYWDEGRVYETSNQITEEWFNHYHWAYGWGFRFIVTPDIVVRFEWGNSEELNPDQLFYMTATLPF